MAQSTTRRLAAVSTGTLLLCLWGGGTAFAATSPTADGSTGGVIGTVTGVLSPSPSPSPVPIATPTELAPVSSVVSQATAVLSAPEPVPTGSSSAPAPVPSGGGTTGSKTTDGTTKVSTTRSQHVRHHVLGTQAMRSSSVSAAPMSLTTLNAAGLRAFGPSAVGVAPLSPQVAPQTAVLAAGQSPALAPNQRGLLPLSGDGDRAPRGLFIALATMVIGGLAAGHVKVAQDRLARFTTTA